MNTQIVKSYWCKCGNPVEITFVKMAKGYSGHGFCKCRKYHEITVTDTEVLKHYLRLHRIQDIELVRDWEYSLDNARERLSEINHGLSRDKTYLAYSMRLERSIPVLETLLSELGICKQPAKKIREFIKEVKDVVYRIRNAAESELRAKFLLIKLYIRKAIRKINGILNKYKEVCLREIFKLVQKLEKNNLKLSLHLLK